MWSMTWAWGLGNAVFAHIPMHVEIGDHAPIHEFAPSEVAGQFDALALTHLARNGEFDLAGKLGVLADFERLDIVPEPFAGRPCLRRIFRQLTSEWTTPRLRKNRGCDQARSSRSREPSGRRLTPPRWSQTCGQ